MRSIAPIVLLVLVVGVVPSSAQTPDLSALPGVPASLVLVTLDTTEYLAEWYLDVSREEGRQFHVEKRALPADFVPFMQSLAPEQTLLLHVFSPDGGLTQDDFPLAEVAAAVNSVKCRHVLTIVDLPTVPRRFEDVTPQIMLAARQRYELFQKGMAVFTSGPFETRLMQSEMQSTFMEWFFSGAYSRFADANTDGSITLWEAYEYAFWGTLADSVRQKQRLQTAFYSLTESWTDQPFLRTGLTKGYRYEPDPQLAAFAEASLRTPLENIVPMGPWGPAGPVGPPGYTWLQGPIPRPLTVEALSAWAWHDVEILHRRLGPIEDAARAIEALGPMPPEPPLILPDNGLMLWLQDMVPGAPGPPGGFSKEARAAREKAVALVDDEQQRAQAAANAELLAQIETAALQFGHTVRMWRWNNRPAGYFAPPSGRPGYCRIPPRWPAALGVPPGPWPTGPYGPAGPTWGLEIKSFQAPSEPLWSATLTRELQALQRRLQTVQEQLKHTPQ